MPCLQSAIHGIDKKFHQIVGAVMATYFIVEVQLWRKLDRGIYVETASGDDVQNVLRVYSSGSWTDPCGTPYDTDCLVDS